MVDGAGHVGEQARVAVAHTADQQADFGAVSDLTPGGQCRPPLEIVDVRLDLIELGHAADDGTKGRQVKMVVAEDEVGANVLGVPHGSAPRMVAGGAAGLQLLADADGSAHDTSGRLTIPPEGLRPRMGAREGTVENVA
jgi:hypothetical protein